MSSNIKQRKRKKVEKVCRYALNEAYLDIKHLLGNQLEQEKAFYCIRDEIDEDLKLCAGNVLVIIYVNNVLDEPMVISSGSEDNELCITIRNDGSVRREWKKITWIPEKINTENVDSNALNDALLKLKPLFKGFDQHLNAFYKVRDEIDGDLEFCADNVLIVIYLNDILDNPLVISSGSKEKQMHITINNDGTVTTAWNRRTSVNVSRIL